MLKNMRNYFFEADAAASPSDKAVLTLVGLSLALAVYAVISM